MEIKFMSDSRFWERKTFIGTKTSFADAETETSVTEEQEKQRSTEETTPEANRSSSVQANNTSDATENSRNGGGAKSESNGRVGGENDETEVSSINDGLNPDIILANDRTIFECVKCEKM